MSDVVDISSHRCLHRQRPVGVPDPQCQTCSGRGWYQHQYEMPGNWTRQSTVRVCECTGGVDR